MEKMIEVEPVEGRTMVREDAPRRRITERMQVPNTAYYRRAIERGDLSVPKKRAPKEG
jgi:hypothetical protein